jgi:hypothetical protein
MSDYKRSLEPCLSFLDLMGPLLPPKVLEGEESIADLVVVLDVFLGVVLLDQVLGELFHWSTDSVEQVSRPSDASRDCGQISDSDH